MTEIYPPPFMYSDKPIKKTKEVYNFASNKNTSVKGGGVYLYNEQFFFWPRLKRKIKVLLGKSLGGPEAVFNSLVLGLKENGITVYVNKKLEGPVEVACVLSGVSTLKWALKQKQMGRIKKLIAGPNIVLTPLDNNRLIMSEKIDTYIVPAQWSVNWWQTFDQAWAKKLKVWPAGVSDLGELVNKTGDMLILYKSGDFDFVDTACEFAQKNKLKTGMLFYGSFKHEQYLELLKTARCMVYVSESESQGLVLHEAWMAGVPTLVYNRGFMAFSKYKWKDEKISAPYLTAECGMFFSNKADLVKKLPEFIKELPNFKPREYSLNNFTNKISAEKFLNIAYEN